MIALLPERSITACVQVPAHGVAIVTSHILLYVFDLHVVLPQCQY